MTLPSKSSEKRFTLPPPSIHAIEGGRYDVHEVSSAIAFGQRDYCCCPTHLLRSKCCNSRSRKASKYASPHGLILPKALCPSPRPDQLASNVN